MNNEVQQDSELKRYLLGELPLEEQVLVEQRLFLDSEYAELLQAVEDELIDEYLAGELAGDERERFKNHFLLLPEHGADLKIAEALKNYIGSDAKPSPAPGTSNSPKDDSSTFLPFSFLNKPFVWLSVTVAALIVLAVITWLGFRSARGPAADAPLQAGDPQPTNTRPDDRQQPAPLPPNDNTVELADKRNTNASGAKRTKRGRPVERVARTRVEPYVLLASRLATRGPGSRNIVTVFPDTDKVTLRLPLEFSESYENYRAELLSGERTIDRWAGLKSEQDEKYGALVSVTVSAEVFREQSYRIRLHGIPSDQQPAERPTTYSFQVERK